MLDGGSNPNKRKNKDHSANNQLSGNMVNPQIMIDPTGMPAYQTINIGQQQPVSPILGMNENNLNLMKNNENLNFNTMGPKVPGLNNNPNRWKYDNRHDNRISPAKFSNINTHNTGKSNYKYNNLNNNNKDMRDGNM
jgi:hypothetical protein